MKKRFFRSALIAVVGLGFAATSSFAAPVTSFPDPSLPSLGGGYSWSNADYWTLTDFTTGGTGNTNFTLVFEAASWDSDFGLYSVDDLSNPTSIASEFKIFDATDEPGTALNPKEVAVYFNLDGSDWYVDLNDDWTDGSNVILDNAFGFYFRTNTGYEWYTDMQFNEVGGVNDGEHIAIAYDPNLKKAQLYLDDQPSSTADHDWMDMVTAGDDLQPIPEPATMLLFGAGLAGLAGISRRKRK